MSWIAGVDGCKAGWVVVLREADSRKIEVRVASRISDVLRWNPSPEVVGVDIPIGLLDRAVQGGRQCDQEARRLLGLARGTSVFSPPARKALGARTFEEAIRRNRSTGPQAPGMTLQGFGILPKIREVDESITPALQQRLVEVHPELSFYEMNGRRAVLEPKKSAAGNKRRIRLLEANWGRKLRDLIDSRPRGVGADDIVDALAVSWTAERILRNEEIRIPAEPPRDSRRLRMEIVR
jgi:predicted RNase H-like nuclease